MVRSALADEHLLSYLSHVAKQNNCSIGLILGQTVNGKDYIIHFAKTPPLSAPDPKEGSPSGCRLKCVADINEEWVADHARQATRMLPGGMHVLGIFIVSPEDVLNPLAPKLKSVLSRIHKLLDSNNHLFGNSDHSEKLVLNYFTNTEQYNCKSYDVNTSSVKPAEVKFMPKAMKWIQLDCKYDMDQVYNIEETESDWPLKKHMNVLLDNMRESLKSSIFLFDGELKGDDDSLESVGKKRKVAKGNKPENQEEHLRLMQVSIMQQCDLKDKSKMFALSDKGNKIRIFGHVSSKLWLQTKVSIRQALEAVKQDIIRSLATRLDMHWDSLTEEEHAEDMNSVHEPPRRVLVNLPHSNIAISDYLFPGEGPQDAQTSLEEMLDIKIHNSSDVMDIEGQADLSEFYNDTVDSDSEEALKKITGENKQSLYIIGVLLAVLVLLISIVIHFGRG